MFDFNATFGEMFSASPFCFIAAVMLIAGAFYIFFKSRFFDGADKNAAPALSPSFAGAVPPAKPVAEGELDIADINDKTTAVLIAITAEELNIPLDKLIISKIKRTGRKKAVKADENNFKYTFKPGEGADPDMKYKITLNDNVYEVTVENGAAAVETVTPETPPAQSTAPAPSQAPPLVPAQVPQKAQGKSVDAPLAGVIMDIHVKQGDAVKSGQLLCILEALKMENEILAPHDGVLSAVHVTKGDAVTAGSPMFTFA